MPLARTTDPQSSHDAAQRAEESRIYQNERILRAMGRHWQTAGEIAQAIGVESVKVSRRLAALRDSGFIEMCPDDDRRLCSVNTSGVRVHTWRVAQ